MGCCNLSSFGAHFRGENASHVHGDSSSPMSPIFSTKKRIAAFDLCNFYQLFLKFGDQHIRDIRPYAAAAASNMGNHKYSGTTAPALSRANKKAYSSSQNFLSNLSKMCGLTANMAEYILTSFEGTPKGILSSTHRSSSV